MLFIFFVTFYMIADGCPWWGWFIFAAAIVYDHFHDKKPTHVIVDKCSNCDKEKN